MNLQGPNFQITNVNHIIFDKDGTLTDAHVYWAEIIRRRSRAICTAFDLPVSLYSSKLELSMGLGLDGFLTSEGPIAIKSRSEVSIVSSMCSLWQYLLLRPWLTRSFLCSSWVFFNFHQFIQLIYSALHRSSNFSWIALSLRQVTY